MAVEDIIRPGDKIDISFVHEVERSQEDRELVRRYKSQVLDVKENGNLEISMPSEGGKLILLPLGVRMEFVFFSGRGLYRADGQVKQRYKSDNVYILEIELRTRLEKYQRREFFRFPCVLDMNYYVITEQEQKIDSGDALFIKIREEDEEQRQEYAGQVVDLSGGGTRFRTTAELNDHSYLLFEIHLKNENLDKLYYIIGNVISCTQVGRGSEKKYEARAKFLIKENSTREEIIRFIFEEERKTRQRGR